MLTKRKEGAVAPRPAIRDPFTLLREMTSGFDEFLAEPFRRWPLLRSRPALESATYFPNIDVFEKDNRLITKIDLPGLEKEDVKVEIVEGGLAISGERRSEAEEKKENFYRCEREYGSFYRTIPLPEGVTADDVKARFANGVLEVSVALPVKTAAKPQAIAIEGDTPAAKTAA